MLTFPNIDPVIFQIGPLVFRWYGFMYVIGFVSSYFLVLYEVKKQRLSIERPKIDDLYFAIILGIIIGGRLGYTLFYNPLHYLTHPLEIFQVWHGGMSFHGGLIGGFAAGCLVIKRKGLPFFQIADLLIPTSTVGLGFGRIGNFINGELFGRPSDVPWAMVFPNGGSAARHPSQLYEAFLEGLVLFTVLWFYKERKKHDGDVFALFLILYGVFRIFCEFFREPDQSVGYILGFLTMGQLLSAAMMAIGLWLKFVYLPKAAPKA
jgi:phosphatidylglycerol---prolipoprotein diacylglyceryl transferase